jgi:hypothetical protein
MVARQVRVGVLRLRQGQRKHGATKTSDGSELRRLAMASGAGSNMMERAERVKESAREEWGARCLPREGRGAAGTRAGKVGARSWHGGHIHGHPSAFESFSRIHVTRRCARLGDHFWASSGSNWTMGPEQNVIISKYSPTLIKGS